MLSYQLTGLAVVFLALTSIWALMTFVGSFFRKAQKPAPAKVAVAAPVAAPAAQEEGISPAVLAVIAAAVHSTLGARARVRSVEVSRPDAMWAVEGRRQIFSSRRVR